MSEDMIHNRSSDAAATICFVHDHVEDHGFEGIFCQDSGKTNKLSVVRAGSQDDVGMLDHMHDIIK